MFVLVIFPKGPRITEPFRLAVPLKEAVAPKVEIPVWTSGPLTVVRPLEVNVVVLTSVKDPAPLDKILAVKAPEAGTWIWLKYPVLA